MMNNQEMIKRLKMNIAISNLKTEIVSNEKQKEYALKNEKFWRLYEMKKRIAIIITSIVLIMSGTVFAFELFSGIDEDGSGAGKREREERSLKRKAAGYDEICKGTLQNQ